MPFVQANVKAEIEQKRESDPEFRKIWDATIEGRTKNNSKFFEDTKNGLLQAIEIERGNIPVKERKNMPAKTYYIDTDN